MYVIILLCFVITHIYLQKDLLSMSNDTIWVDMWKVQHTTLSDEIQHKWGSTT